MTLLNGFTLQDIYSQAHLAALGVSWEAFTADPYAMLHAAGQQDALDLLANGYRPLLPAQVRLRQQLIADWQHEGTWDDALRQRRIHYRAIAPTHRTGESLITLLL